MHRTSPRTLLILPALLSALLAAATAGAQSAGDLQRCRDMKDAAARLACYDAIPLGSGAPATPGAQQRASAPVASAPTSAAAPRAPQATDFGLERRVEQQREEIKTMESRILGPVDGWEPNTRFTLENGQVWQVSDDSRAFGNANNPKVKISRGTFGTFFLEIEGINAAPRVRRVR
jgi:hypothetical protein